VNVRWAAIDSHHKLNGLQKASFIAKYGEPRKKRLER